MMNMKRQANLNSTNYSKAPMITNSLSSISPRALRPKRNAPLGQASMTIDVDASGGLGLSSLQQTPPPRK